MTNLISPAASAAQGIPRANDMSDVIDSLKRLERIGSDHSKTTEKLLSAAREASALIARQFFPDAATTVIDRSSVTPLYDLVVCGFEKEQRPGTNSVPETAAYEIVRDGESFRLDRNGVFVGQNRDAALAFAADIASGLLDLIIETLTEREWETQAGLRVIGTATASLMPKPALALPASATEEFPRAQAQGSNFPRSLNYAYDKLKEVPAFYSLQVRLAEFERKAKAVNRDPLRAYIEIEAERAAQS